MAKFRVNDVVTLMNEPKSSVNRHARVYEVLVDGFGNVSYWLINGNMPFSGTYSIMDYMIVPEGCLEGGCK